LFEAEFLVGKSWLVLSGIYRSERKNHKKTGYCLSPVPSWGVKLFSGVEQKDDGESLDHLYTGRYELFLP
jgi:hypothetical protein